MHIKKVENEKSEEEQLLEELVDLLGEDLTAKEKKVLLYLSEIMTDFEKAVMSNDKAQIESERQRYKLAYKDYQLGMVNQEDLQNLNKNDRSILEEQIDEESELMLKFTEKVAEGDMSDEELAALIDYLY